jgi:phosphoglycerol transferase MdoB-like AlkP superfamily enzyme
VKKKDNLHKALAVTGQLLLPWPALTFGFALLSLVQWWTLHLNVTELQQILVADVLMLPKAVLLWCLLTAPMLTLHRHWQFWIQGLLGSVCLLTAAALDLYFWVSGVPLGSDLLAYSWPEIRTTVSGAQVALPMTLMMALIISLLSLWISLWWAMHLKRATLTARTTALVMGICVAGSLALPTTQAGASSLAQNKLQFFVSDLLAFQTPKARATAGDYPFEHVDTTPDTLGPLLDLNAKEPPNLVFIVVEGLGRSFSGPGARLGSFTPFLDELAGKSLYWDNFLATQGRTFAVLPSLLGSLPFGPYGEKSISNDNLLSLLKRRDYSLRYFTGSNLSFDHQGAFLAESGVSTFWSEKNFNKPQDKLSEWGYPDGDLLQALAQSATPPSPSVTVVQTMSMHTPFLVPQAQTYRKKVYDRLDALGVVPSKREPYRQQIDVYASILYTDEALQTWMKQAALRPQWKNTIVIITGDHRLPELPMASRIERYHVPLLVYSPMLKAPRRIKAVSSHFDIAPAFLAMLSHRYGYPMPSRTHWMGSGLDVNANWRNVHTVPLKQTKTELSDYVSGEYYLAQNRLFTLQDGMVTALEDNPAITQELQAEFTNLKSHLTQLPAARQLVSEAGRTELSTYQASTRTLEHPQRVHQIEGLVVSQAQGHLSSDGVLTASGTFSQQGRQDSAVFVPLLVLSDENGKEWAEVSGQAMRLRAGQSEPVSLKLQQPQLPSGNYFLSLVVSHPETGRPIGKGQYHVEIKR